jgi:DNA-binding PadR family transcriptional regulator
MGKHDPLPPATFLVLMSLAAGDRHGYGIMQDVRRLDSGFEIGPATLYTTLQRLLANGWVAEVGGPESGERRRRYYRITSEGTKELESELRRMKALVRQSRRLGLNPQGAER